MPLPAVPPVEKIGEPVIPEARDLTNDWQTYQVPDPAMSRGAEPDFDGTINPDIEAPSGIDSMEPAAHVLHPRAEASECFLV
jgi:hypothetical protein